MMTTTTSTTDTNKERSIPATESTPTSTATQTPLAQYGLPGPLLLGSASFTRKLILNEMGIPYKKFVRPINEKLIGTRDGGGASQPNPTELVLLVAHAKMDRLVHELQQQEEPPDEVANIEQGCVVLTGDQVVLCRNTILEKPDSVAEAQNMVAMYVTHPPSTIGSCVLYHHPSGIRVSGTDTATIHFNATTLGANASSSKSSSEGGTTPPTTTTIPASHALITDLLALNQPVLSCAGGLMIEHPLVQRHILSIEGTEDSVMGLSKQLVLTLFEELQAKLAAAGTADADEPCN